MGSDTVNSFDEEVFHLGGSCGKKDFFIERKDNTITVEAVKEAFDPLLDFISEYLIKNQCSKEVKAEIRLAVEEIFVNICSYAYEPGNGEARINCRVVEDQSYILIQFTDTGIPFNPLHKETPDITGKQFENKQGGFGIHLVKQVMDEVTYEYRDGMNILRIKRFFENKG